MRWSIPPRYCLLVIRPSAYQPQRGWFCVARVLSKPEGTMMARFTHENAAAHGRRGGQRSHQRLEAQYADLVLSNPSAAERVAHLIRQGRRLALALRVIKITDRMNQRGQ